MYVYVYVYTHFLALSVELKSKYNSVAVGISFAQILISKYLGKMADPKGVVGKI